MSSGIINTKTISNATTVLVKNIMTYITQKVESAKELIFTDSTKKDNEVNISRINFHFPATTEEITTITGKSYNSTKNLLLKLRKGKLIKSRKFSWFKISITFHIPYNYRWPSYLFNSCGSCENWNRYTKECTFIQELISEGFQVKTERTKRKIHKGLAACKWLIARSKRALHTFESLQDFAEKTCLEHYWWSNDFTNLSLFSKPNVPLNAYCCYNCGRYMPQFGWGFLPKVSSSLTVCDHCGSIYKLFLDQATETYKVIYSKEKYDEYSKRFKLYTGLSEVPKIYSSDQYGFTIGELNEQNDLLFEIDAIASLNLFAFFNQINYLVAQREKDYHSLKEKLAEDYPTIQVYLAKQPLESVPPTKKQQAAVKLLRRTGVLSYDYALSLLRSRLTTLEELGDYVDQRKISKVIETAIQTILLLEHQRKAGIPLTREQWNEVDGKVARGIWDLILEVMQTNGFHMPNRSIARHLEDDWLRPYGYYPSFTTGNSVFNGVFRLITNVYIRSCNDLEFPWEGLVGICHNKTSHGEYGLLLDTSEALKQMIIPETIKAIIEEEITAEFLTKIRLRKRMEVSFYQTRSPGLTELETVVERTSKSKIVAMINGQEQKVTVRKAIKNHILGLKKLLKDIIWNDTQSIKIDNTHYSPWKIMDLNLWDKLPLEQQRTITKSLTKIVVESKRFFSPLKFQRKFSTELDDYEKLEL